ncbi:hypothetical protein ACJIZ3_010796 [Penstemon smallii]|uniref:Uncharacterized protein n=1 Tax=Penstemon smallii TaxID=265156 RepID=A0ABD3UHA3_9LAMI
MAAMPTTTTAVLEHCQVTPPPDAEAEKLLHLTHSDIWWLPSIISQIVLFYEIPCSKTRFLETVIPNLKYSLSLTLKHFLPMAGNLFLPLGSGMPVCRYTKGDSVPVTIAISDSDFVHLTGNHPRSANEFRGFVSQLPPLVNHSPESIKIPPFAIQITLFPNKGICIGFTIHHSLCDGAALLNFIKTWASITDSNSDTHAQWLPFYDRTTFQDLDGLDSIRWNQVKVSRPTIPTSFSNNKVRATFVLSKDDVQKLKDVVLERRPNIAYVSTFTVACAYVWVSIAKLTVVVEEEVADNEPDYFIFSADCRGRLNPPLPGTYFGNCLALMKAETSHGVLKGNEGFLEAVEAIGEEIRKTVYNENGVLDSIRKRSTVEFKSLIGKRVLYVAGSPRLDIYGVDFGWGKVKKYESVNIDLYRSISIYKSREIEGGLEIGFSGSNIQMDAFTTIFKEGLNSSSNPI